MNRKVQIVGSLVLLSSTLIFLEVTLRVCERYGFFPKPSAADFVAAERLWFRRNPEVSKRPLASFDSELGWIADRAVRDQPGDRPIVAIFGDSWTYGMGVLPEETYPEVINELMPIYDTRNFGVNGYGIDQMILLAERMIPRIQPRWIVIAFIGPDLHRTCFPFYFGKRKPRWADFRGVAKDTSPILSPAELGIIHNNPVDRLGDWVVANGLRFRLVKLFASVFYQPVVKNCEAELNVALLERALKNWGDRVIFVHLGLELPTRFQSLVAKRRIPIFSVKAQIETRIASAGALDSSLEHPGPRYHRAIAEILANEIKRREAALAVSCPSHPEESNCG